MIADWITINPKLDFFPLVLTEHLLSHNKAPIRLHQFFYSLEDGDSTIPAPHGLADGRNSVCVNIVFFDVWVLGGRRDVDGVVVDDPTDEGVVVVHAGGQDAHLSLDLGLWDVKLMLQNLLVCALVDEDVFRVLEVCPVLKKDRFRVQRTNFILVVSHLAL